MNYDCTYCLVPVGVGVGDQITKGIHGLGLFGAAGNDLLGGGLLGHGSGGSGCGLDGFGLGVEGADVQLGLVLLQDTLVVVLPELLGGVLSGDALEDLLAT